MATTEAGHQADRWYADADGHIHLNGCNLYIDESGSILVAADLGLIDGITAGAWAASKACTLDSSGDATLVDGTDFVLGSTTGTKIGTATTQKLGFFNATPIVQRSAYTQTYSTADKTHAAATAGTLTVADGAGTNDGTIAAITTGGASADQSAVIAAIQELADQINKLIADQLDTKQLVNSVIDDLQALGLVG